VFRSKVAYECITVSVVTELDQKVVVDRAKLGFTILKASKANAMRPVGVFLSRDGERKGGGTN
jgi:hypothetical protein